MEPQNRYVVKNESVYREYINTNLEFVSTVFVEEQNEEEVVLSITDSRNGTGEERVVEAENFNQLVNRDVLVEENI